MKTIVLVLTTLFLFSFSMNPDPAKDNYIIPKDAKKAAVIINEAFATSFKTMKVKVIPKQIRYVNGEELQKLIYKNPNISKEHQAFMIDELKKWKEVRATIFDFADLKLCEGESNFTAIIEGEGYLTRRAFVYSTCGLFRCVLNGYTPQNFYDCEKGVGPIQRVDLCTESSDLCCVGYYCPGSECPNYSCIEKGECPNCN